jgi:two-component system sensor histidine kinase YesM
VGVSFLNRLIRSIQPSSLKYRLFFAFLLLIILPFFALQVRNHTQVESLYEYRISEQSQYQLDQVKQSFEQIKSQMLLTALQLEKETAVQTALKKETEPGAFPSQSGIMDPVKRMASWRF